jgi:hypothetical protein
MTQELLTEAREMALLDDDISDELFDQSLESVKAGKNFFNRSRMTQGGGIRVFQ